MSKICRKKKKFSQIAFYSVSKQLRLVFLQIFATVCSHSSASDLSITWDFSLSSPLPPPPQPDTLQLSGPQASVYSAPSAVWDNDGQIQPTVK